MIVRLYELEKFEAAAHDAGAAFVECMLTDQLDSSVSRFHRRGSSDSRITWHRQVRALVAASGGDQALAQSHRGLDALLRQRPKSIVVPSVEDAADETYQTLIGALTRGT